MSNQNELKILPYNPKISKIFKLWPEIPEKKLRNEIHTIKRANRKLPPGEKITDHHMYTSEFIELVNLIGMAKGYRPYPGWEHLFNWEG